MTESVDFRTSWRPLPWRHFDAGASAEVFQTQAVPIETDHRRGRPAEPLGSRLPARRRGDRDRTRGQDAHRLRRQGCPSRSRACRKSSARGQGGLLDVVAAPDFATSNLIFFSFSEPGRGGAGTAVARAKLVRDGASGGWRMSTVIFSMAKKTTMHPPFRLAPGVRARRHAVRHHRRSRRRRPRAGHAGSCRRGHPDQHGRLDPGRQPLRRRRERLPEIWSKGHRNPQGAACDPVTRRAGHRRAWRQGRRRGQPAAGGKNYGWPVISYGVNYSGSEDRRRHRERRATSSPSTIGTRRSRRPAWPVYQGDMFPEWKGDLLVGSLKFAAGFAARPRRERQDPRRGTDAGRRVRPHPRRQRRARRFDLAADRRERWRGSSGSAGRTEHRTKRPPKGGRSFVSIRRLSP